jgi:NAD dependent epimerase/dehydratase family enzyme
MKLVPGWYYVLVSVGLHVLPARLIQEGFNFRYPRIADAIQNMVEKI